MVFQLILPIYSDLWQFGAALQFLLDHATTTDSCLMYVIRLDCCILTRVESPSRTTAKQVHKPLFLLAFFLPYLCFRGKKED